MLNSYIIRAAVDADETQAAGMYVRDWFDCGINDKSDCYPSADAALMAARAAYKGPNADGIECRVWAERTAEWQAAMKRAGSEDRGSPSPLDWSHYGRYQFKDICR